MTVREETEAVLREHPQVGHVELVDGRERLLCKCGARLTDLFDGWRAHVASELERQGLLRQPNVGPAQPRPEPVLDESD